MFRRPLLTLPLVALPLTGCAVAESLRWAGADRPAHRTAAADVKDGDGKAGGGLSGAIAGGIADAAADGIADAAADGVRAACGESSDARRARKRERRRRERDPTPEEWRRDWHRDFNRRRRALGAPDGSDGR